MKIKEVLNNDLCLGCGLCESVFGKTKIMIDYDKNGFLRPKLLKELNKEEENLFGKLCPGAIIKHKTTKGHDAFLGKFKYISTGFASNENIRYGGSSGGVVTGLAYYLLAEDKVDCVIQIGASKKEPIRNEVKIITCKQDLLSNSGSRYAPSATLINIKEIIDDVGKNRIALIGKPCDIVGVRNLMKNSNVARTKIKFLISFMCAGLPSLKGSLNLLNEFGVHEKDVKSLKYRGDGWPGNFKVEDRHGNIYRKSYNESWGTELNKHLQFRCKICPDGTGEFADITCADAWESSNNGYPSFEERPGQSLIICRTKEGNELLLGAIKKDYIKLSKKKLIVSEVKKMQPYQVNRKKNLLPRLIAVKLAGRKGHNYNFNLLVKSSFKENPLRLLKNFLGMLKRVY